MIVRMCEMVAHTDAVDDLVRWVCDAGVPDVERDPDHVASEVFASADARIVVISRWRSSPRSLPDPPRHLVARAPHSWDFSPIPHDR